MVFVKSGVSLEQKHDNVDPRFVDLLNRLGALREPARYVARDFELSEREMEQMISVAQEMHGSLWRRARAGRRSTT